MGGGPAPRKVLKKMEIGGGIGKSGVPTVNCPPGGTLEAEATERSRDGVVGRLAVKGTRLEFITEEGATAAVALTSAEASRVSDCILDGLDYGAVLRRSSERWLISYREE